MSFVYRIAGQDEPGYKKMRPWWVTIGAGFIVDAMMAVVRACDAFLTAIWL